MLRPEPEGGYTALVPALPGCVTYGRTVDEAREMAKDAISGYIASLRKHKDPIPSDDDTLVASLDFRVLTLISRPLYTLVYGFVTFVREMSSQSFSTSPTRLLLLLVL